MSRDPRGRKKPTREQKHWNESGEIHNAVHFLPRFQSLPKNCLVQRLEECRPAGWGGTPIQGGPFIFFISLKYDTELACYVRWLTGTS